MSDDLKTRLLVVDDEQSIRKLCMTIGTSLGYECAEAESAESALTRIEAEAPDLVLTDLKLPNQSGVELLKRTKEILPHTEIAIMTGHGSIESAVDAMKLGAYDYIEKPFRVEKMRLLLQRMSEKVRLVTENEFLRERVSTETNLDGIIGASANIQDVLRMISRLKDTRTPVLVSGESGTGKELVARAIHFRGALAKTPFVAVDCGSLVPTLMESELFGYEKGAFTGATKSKAGLFQAANSGTIFLDEIGEMPLQLQTKILRVLQEREVQRIGSSEPVPVDVRVIAASNQSLVRAVAQRRFRDDLYYRLNVVALRMPPLRERISDIPELALHFLDKVARQESCTPKRIDPSALDVLMRYGWPGNVRQLEHALESAVALSGSRTTLYPKDFDLPMEMIAAELDPLALLDVPESGINFEELIMGIERRLLERALQKSGGNKARAANMLNMKRTTLISKFKSLETCA